ncbi:MAG: hypothetical protein KDA83_02675 [Planctomycetales bacterium]|nr:hypothetical protein [Planctomycetales bacterium]
MTRLLVLDPSLKGPGGHHFDYTRQVITACARLGVRADVAAHRKFSATDALVADISVADVPHQANTTHVPAVFPHFRNTTYHACSDLIGVRALVGEPRRSPAGYLARLRKALLPPSHTGNLQEWMGQLSAPSREALGHLDPCQQQVILETSHDLESLMASHAGHLREWYEVDDSGESSRAFLDDDRLWRDLSVFHTTLSELDFLAIAIGLYEGRLPRVARWSLQFHFDLYLGRPHEYEAQFATARAQRARRSFEAAAQLSRGHEIQLFATSEPLAAQYNTLGVGQVEPLTYPINPAFQPTDVHDLSQPCRITLAGGVRGEKGQRRLDPICSAIGPTVLEPGAGVLVAQRRRRPWWRQPQLCVSEAHSGPKQDWVRYADHPLSEQDYVGLIRDAGIGLLLYDSRTYYSRRAGVLGEFMAAGVPTIVPAGCWLADQVETPNRAYWRRLCQESGVPCPTHPRGDASRTNHSEFAIDVPTDDSLLIFSGRVAPFDALQPRHVSIHWAGRPTESAGPSTSLALGTFGVRDGQFWACLPASHVAKLRDGDSLDLSFTWAHTSNPVSLIESPTVWRVGPETQGGARPWGAVGWVVPDLAAVPAAIEQIVRHRAHYRENAVRYAPQWHRDHDPDQTVRQVTRIPEARQRIAA